MESIRKLVIGVKTRWAIAKGLLLQDAVRRSDDQFRKRASLFFIIIAFCGSLFFEASRWMRIRHWRRKFRFSKLSVVQKKTIEEFRGKVLGQQNYKVDSKYYAEDFSSSDKFHYVIGELESREAELTIDGFEFLEKFYGLENLARILYDIDSDFPGKSASENLDWLLNLNTCINKAIE
jgi:hypothetical protein